MGQVRWSVDPKATVPLRFDDADFLDALRADGDAEDPRPLASLLDVKVAADVDFSAMVADGVCIVARETITGPESDRLQVAMQLAERRGTKYNANDYNREWWATWVLGVTDEVDGLPDQLRKGLNSADKSQRAEAICNRLLPLGVRQRLFARLRAHEEAVKAPAMRDPQPSAATAED